MLWCCRILPFNIRSPIKSSARFCISAREHISHWPPNNHQCKAFSPIQQWPAVEEEKFEHALRRYYGKLRWSGDLRISRLLLALPAEWNTWCWNRPMQKITIEANKKVVNFLDVTLDLNTGIFKPFSKPSNTALYVHSKSNHPPSIIRNIPESIKSFSQKFHLMKLCSTNLQPRIRKHCTRVDIRTNWSLNHRKPHHLQDVIDPGK